MKSGDVLTAKGSVPDELVVRLVASVTHVVKEAFLAGRAQALAEVAERLQNWDDAKGAVPDVPARTPAPAPTVGATDRRPNVRSILFRELSDRQGSAPIAALRRSVVQAEYSPDAMIKIRTRLVRDGLITTDRLAWTLTPAGWEAVAKAGVGQPGDEAAPSTAGD